MYMSTEHFVFANNKLDGNNYIGTFRYVDKDIYLTKESYPKKTTVEIGVFASNSTKPALFQALTGPKAFFEFSGFGNLTKEEIDNFVISLISNENLHNINVGDPFARGNKNNHYLRDTTTSLNLPFFNKINTFVYTRLDDEYIEEHRDDFN